MASRHWTTWATGPMLGFFLLIGCDDDEPTTTPPVTYTVGGMVTGLSPASRQAGGSGLVLQNNGGDNLDVDADGEFTFATSISDGSTYDVSVLTQPAGQTCTVADGTGTLEGADVSDVQITCADRPATVRLNLDHVVAAEPFVMDTGEYSDPAGNTYRVQNLLYIVTDFELVEAGPAPVRVEFAIGHLRDGEDDDTSSIILSDVPFGSYEAISFTFGLDEEDNVSSQEGGPWPAEWDNAMAWPARWGGGLHYMKIEGHFDPAGGGGPLAFLTHTGRRNAQSDPVFGTDPVPIPHFFTVTLPIDVIVTRGQTWEIQIIMDIDKWYDGVNQLTMDDFTTGVMMNTAIQNQLEQNGPDCFSVGSVQNIE